MIILTITGNPHNGNTKALTDMFLYEFENNEVEVDEIVLPKDMPDICNGCAKCILQGEEKCPHFKKIRKIVKKMEIADVIVLATPVYVKSCSSAMKVLLDHFVYMWLNHRPNEKMFKKLGVILTTAGGWGEKETVKLLKDNLFYLGISKTYSYSITADRMIASRSNDKEKAKIQKELHKKANKVKRGLMHRKPSFKMKFQFNLFRMSQKHGVNKTVSNYWRRKGWLDKNRPY